MVSAFKWVQNDRSTAQTSNVWCRLTLNLAMEAKVSGPLESASPEDWGSSLGRLCHIGIPPLPDWRVRVRKSPGSAVQLGIPCDNTSTVINGGKATIQRNARQYQNLIIPHHVQISAYFCNQRGRGCRRKKIIKTAAPGEENEAQSTKFI